MFTLPDEFKRGHIKSWNVAFQKELRWGFVGEAAYVAHAADRSARLPGAELVADRRRAGGPAAESAVRPHRPDPADRADRRQQVRRAADAARSAVRERLPARRQLHACRSRPGSPAMPNSDGALRINIPEFYHLNRAISDFDRTHNLNITNIVELPFGPGRRWLNGGGVLAQIVGGWQVNNILSFYSGTPFSVTAAGHVAERAGERSARRPGEGRRGDPRRYRAATAPTSIRWRSGRSPRRASAPRRSTCCAGPGVNVGSRRVPAGAAGRTGRTCRSASKRSTSPTPPRFSQSRRERVEPAAEPRRHRREPERVRGHHRHHGRQRAADAGRRSIRLVTAVALQSGDRRVPPISGRPNP